MPSYYKFIASCFQDRKALARGGGYVCGVLIGKNKEDYKDLSNQIKGIGLEGGTVGRSKRWLFFVKFICFGTTRDVGIEL